MTAGWCSRTLRAAVFAAVCVLLAALGHTMMSADSVPEWTLAGGFLAAGVLGWCLASRERGLLSVVTVVVTVQTALHTAFSLTQSRAAAVGHTPHAAASVHQGHHPMGAGGTGQDHPGAVERMAANHGHGASIEHAGDASLLGGVADVGHSGHTHYLDVLFGDTSSLGMLVAHLLAALLAGLWLAHGERAAFRILRALAGWLTAPLRLLSALPVPPYRPRLRRRRGPSSPSRLLPLVYAIVSRGPPAGFAVV
ncbi:hypothetical protein V1460_20025 [Streptomyces sp. SCSIO 30461]|uniref:hypothetical protein n=1 Tax=Streptomyces sp. SCSIO 30461 TaxID=3118085 RepID=UPI0030CEEC80